jgi:hypothetical protein
VSRTVLARRLGRLCVVMALVSTAVAAAWSPAAADATTANQRVRIVFAGGYSGVALASGVINAVGAAQEESTLHPDGSFVGRLTFRFPLGTVTAPFEGQVTSVTVDPTTCVGRFTSVGSFTIGSATGLYRGTTGHGTFTEAGMFNSLPTPSGCSPEPLLRTLLVTEAVAHISR